MEAVAALAALLSSLWSAHAREDQWAGRADWERTVALAKQEGKVAISGPVGTTWRAALTSFEQDFGIKVEYTPARAHEFWPRLALERSFGKHLWDLRLTPSESQVFRLLRAGTTIAPVRDLLVLPDVINDANWVGGFDAIFNDRAKKHVIGFGLEALPIAWVNRDTVPEAELPQFKDLAHPKWKGRVSIQDLRGAASIANLAILLRAPQYGENFLDQVVIENKAVIIQNPRQQIEWLIRGRYPIAIAILSALLVEFKQHGLAQNVMPLTDIPKYSSGSGGLIAIRNPPHPNAAKVYANWVLGHVAQTRIAQTVRYNSRRTDVPIQEPLFKVDPSRINEYQNTQSEDFAPYLERALEYARKVEGRMAAGDPKQ
jgi:ABC-type Fe3+ transport system substrate-binding protein